MDWIALNALGARQAGRLRVTQAPDCGVGVSTVQRRATREQWPRPQPGVVVLPGGRDDFLGHAWSAVLSAGSRALLAGKAAAHLHGLLVDVPTLVEVVVPIDRSPRLRPPAQVRRSRTMLLGDAARLEGLPVTDIERTLSDVTAWHGRGVGQGMALDAFQRRRTTPQRVVDRLDQRGPIAGRGALREACRLALDGVQSVFEAKIPPLLARAGLPPMVSQVEVARRDGGFVHLDFGWPDVEVGVECLGVLAHSERLQVRRDVRRLNGLRGSDWSITYVEWSQLLGDPAKLVADLARERALARRRAS